MIYCLAFFSGVFSFLEILALEVWLLKPQAQPGRIVLSFGLALLNFAVLLLSFSCLVYIRS